MEKRLIGARQVGKTTLLKNLVKGQENLLWLNGDDIEVRTMLQNVSTIKFKSLLGQNKMMVVDEAQRIENIGLKMKLITDNFPDVQLILTGSSSFDLANKINEPLTGRKWEYTLFPLSFGELASHNGTFDEIRHLPLRLVFGSYPDVVNNSGDEREILMQLTNSYLYKDILEWERIKKPDKLVRLLQALAYQVGSEVSLTELGNLVELDKNTVEKYITLLEQTQVIFRLSSLSRNMRNELKNSKKIYFYDNGIRNALISNFSPIEIRTDTGALWENFIISERLKFTEYNDIWSNRYFWRTKEQHEIDYVEDRDGTLYAYEFKFNPKKKVKIPNSFLQNYPTAVFKEITPENMEDFILL